MIMKLYPLDIVNVEVTSIPRILDCHATNVYLSAIKMNRAQFSIRKIENFAQYIESVLSYRARSGVACFIEKTVKLFLQQKVYKVS